MNHLVNVEAEQAVIGAILVDPDCYRTVIDLVQPEDFGRTAHAIIMSSIVELDEMGKPIDLINLTEFLHESGQVKRIGGISYLSNLQRAVPTSANVDHYCEIVKKYSNARMVFRFTEEAATALEQREHPDSVVMRLEDNLRQSSSQRVKTDFLPMKDVLLNTFERIEFLFNNKGAVTGIPSGFTDLDKLTSGFQRKDLIVIGARPAIGKTALALNIGQEVAIRTNQAVAIFSLEMGAEQLVQRMLCAEANIDANKMRTGFLDDDHWPRLAMAVSALSEAPIYLDDTPGIKVGEIRAKCRRLKDQVGELGMIIVDYLQLVQPNRQTGNRVDEVSQISRMLKLIAKELNVPVVALSQLSRSVEQRQDKRPVMADLRESGSIEQDADIVAFLYRDDYYNPESDRKNIIEIIIAKHRSGPTGTVELVFLKNFNKFVNLERSPASLPAPSPAEHKQNAQPSIFDQIA